MDEALRKDTEEAAQRFLTFLKSSSDDERHALIDNKQLLSNATAALFLSAHYTPFINDLDTVNFIGTVLEAIYAEGVKAGRESKLDQNIWNMED